MQKGMTPIVVAMTAGVMMISTDTASAISFVETTDFGSSFSDYSGAITLDAGLNTITGSLNGNCGDDPGEYNHDCGGAYASGDTADTFLIYIPDTLTFSPTSFLFNIPNFGDVYGIDMDVEYNHTSDPDYATIHSAFSEYTGGIFSATSGGLVTNWPSESSITETFSFLPTQFPSGYYAFKTTGILSDGSVAPGSYSFDYTLKFDLVEKPPAVPLPAGLPLLASCFGLLGFLGWRRRSFRPA